eukprot:m.266637 g.266637  ORF g.266637 m.266637 type:complete len:207 (+) comp16239_c0_seq96:286-906(+)
MSNKEYPRNWATILSRMSISDIHIEDCQRYAEMQVYLTFLSLTKWELLVVIEMFRDLFEKSSTQLQEATKIENFRGQQRSMAIKALFQENKKLKARIQELESANIRSDNPRHQQALNHSITPTRRNSTSVGNQFMRGSYETPQFNRSRELTNPGSARVNSMYTVSINIIFTISKESKVINNPEPHYFGSLTSRWNPYQKTRKISNA